MLDIPLAHSNEVFHKDAQTRMDIFPMKSHRRVHQLGSISCVYELGRVSRGRTFAADYHLALRNFLQEIKRGLVES